MLWVYQLRAVVFAPDHTAYSIVSLAPPRWGGGPKRAKLSAYSCSRSVSDTNKCVRSWYLTQLKYDSRIDNPLNFNHSVLSFQQTHYDELRPTLQVDKGTIGITWGR